jgi:hypothetical protein
MNERPEEAPTSFHETRWMTATAEGEGEESHRNKTKERFFRIGFSVIA